MTTTLLVLTFLALVFSGCAKRRFELALYLTSSVAFAAGAVLTWLVAMGRV